jgi:hypothetical protein
MCDSSDVTGAAVQVRLEGPLFAELENWRRAQPKIIPRSWALRQLLMLHHCTLSTLQEPKSSAIATRLTGASPALTSSSATR